MTPFRKLWNTFIDAIKPRMLRGHYHVGPHSVIVDTRPFNVTKGR
jgi:hypothetical protein